MRTFTAAFFILVVSLAAQTQNRLLSRPPAGFTSLFDGKDLAGWRGRQPNYDPRAEAQLSKEDLAAKQAQWNAARDLHWRVDATKSEIVSDGQSPHLATVKDYGDFELYVDWLMVSHNGDSGIYLAATRRCRSGTRIIRAKCGTARRKGRALCGTTTTTTPASGRL